MGLISGGAKNVLSVENINVTSIKRATRLANNIFFILILEKKSKNNPNANNIDGILFPEKNNPAPKIKITITPATNFL